jgi:chromate transporter
LIIAGVLSLFRLADGGVTAFVIAGLSGTILYFAPRFPVLGVLALGGLAAMLASTLSTWVSAL